MDERGRLLLGAHDAFAVYDAVRGEPIFRFRRRAALPLRFVAMRWSGSCVVTLEAKGARVFRVLPRLAGTAARRASASGSAPAKKRFTDNMNIDLPTASSAPNEVDDESFGACLAAQLAAAYSAGPRAEVCEEERPAPLIIADGGARFTSLECSLDTALLGDSFGRLHAIRLNPHGAQRARLLMRAASHTRVQTTTLQLQRTTTHWRPRRPTTMTMRPTTTIRRPVQAPAKA